MLVQLEARFMRPADVGRIWADSELVWVKIWVKIAFAVTWGAGYEPPTLDARGSSLCSGLTESHGGGHIVQAGPLTTSEVGDCPRDRVDNEIAEFSRRGLTWHAS